MRNPNEVLQGIVNRASQTRIFEAASNVVEQFNNSSWVERVNQSGAMNRINNLSSAGKKLSEVHPNRDDQGNFR